MDDNNNTVIQLEIGTGMNDEESRHFGFGEEYSEWTISFTLDQIGP